MYKTLKEASEFLGKSEKTVGRYIKRGILHPDKVKSQNGTLEYRFLAEELEALQEKIDRTRQTGHQTGHQTEGRTQETAFSWGEQTEQTGHQTGQTGHQTGQTGHAWTDEKAFLYDQIAKKDKQIDQRKNEKLLSEGTDQ